MGLNKSFSADDCLEVYNWGENPHAAVELQEKGFFINYIDLLCCFVTNLKVNLQPVCSFYLKLHDESLQKKNTHKKNS